MNMSHLHCLPNNIKFRRVIKVKRLIVHLEYTIPDESWNEKVDDILDNEVPSDSFWYAEVQEEIKRQVWKTIEKVQ